MKVTLILADDLVNSVVLYTRSSTIEEAIAVALKEWVNVYSIKELNKQIKIKPMFIENCKKIRKINRFS